MKQISDKTTRRSLFTFASILGVGGFVGTWSLMALFSSLNKVSWNVMKLYEQYKLAANPLESFPSVIDFSTYISYSMYFLPLFLLYIFLLLFRYIIKKKERLAQS